jgi:hypothetical protein
MWFFFGFVFFVVSTVIHKVNRAESNDANGNTYNTKRSWAIFIGGFAFYALATKIIAPIVAESLLPILANTSPSDYRILENFLVIFPFFFAVIVADVSLRLAHKVTDKKVNRRLDIIIYGPTLGMVGLVTLMMLYFAPKAPINQAKTPLQAVTTEQGPAEQPKELKPYYGPVIPLDKP